MRCQNDSAKLRFIPGGYSFAAEVRKLPSSARPKRWTTIVPIYIIYIYYYYMRHMYIYYIYLVNPNPNFSSGINKTIPRVFHEFEKYLGYGRKTSGLSSVSSSILLRPSFVPQVLVHYRTEPFCISLPPLFEIYLCPNPLHSLVTQFFMIFVSKSSGFSKTHTKPVLINP